MKGSFTLKNGTPSRCGGEEAGVLQGTGCGDSDGLLPRLCWLDEAPVSPANGSPCDGDGHKRDAAYQRRLWLWLCFGLVCGGRRSWIFPGGTTIGLTVQPGSSIITIGGVADGSGVFSTWGHGFVKVALWGLLPLESGDNIRVTSAVVDPETATR